VLNNYSDWTAGQHWQAAVEALVMARDDMDTPTEAGACASIAMAHLAAAQLLLDHPPARWNGEIDAYEPDWRIRGIQQRS